MDPVLLGMVVVLLLAASYGWWSESKKHPGIERSAMSFSTTTDRKKLRLRLELDELERELGTVRLLGEEPIRHAELEDNISAIRAELYTLEQVSSEEVEKNAQPSEAVAI